MTQSEAKSILVKSFLALDVKGRRNLKWHLENGTKVLCGKGSSSHFVLDGKP